MTKNLQKLQGLHDVGTIVAVVALFGFWSSYSWFLKAISWPLYSDTPLQAFEFTAMMATISFYTASKREGGKSKYILTQFAVAILSICAVFENSVGFFRTEPTNIDPRGWSSIIASESWKVENEIDNLRSSIARNASQSEQGNADLIELGALQVHALRLSRLEALEEQFARYKTIDAAAVRFDNAFEQRYFPVALLILFHSALIFRPYSMRGRSDP
jgi:hypothetical protein